MNVLPLTNPVRLAEEITTLDHICQGRFELGVGRSSGQEAYVGFNVPYTESQSRFSEALDIIQLALTQDRFSYHGRFHTYKDICVVPRPYQRPHPPIRIAITSPESFARAGSMGLPIFIGLIASTKVMEERLSSYWDAWKQAGHPGQGDVYLRLAVHVGNTSESAVEEPKQSALNFYNNILANQNNPIPGLSVEENRSREKRRSLMANVTYEQILRDHVICGTPDTVTERLLDLKNILRIRGAIIDVNLGGMIAQHHLNNSLRLLSHEVAHNLLNARTESPSS